MADDKARKDFFISYTGADRSWAEWIAWQLEQANYSVILQAWDFRPGGNFVLDMDQTSRQCDRTMAVLSADYFKSKYTPSEWAAAFRQDPLSQQKRLLPVRVRDCDIEGLLGQIVCIDLVGKDQEAARLALLAGVSPERPKPATAPPFPVTTSSSADSSAFPGVLPAIWTVPSLRNPYFTGREEPLEQLADAFEGRGAAGMRQPNALSGLGGIGKTQIAIEYAYRFSTRYQAVLWARAGSRDTLITDYISFVPPLGLPQTEEAEQLLVVREVKLWLANHAGWLLILDNADDLVLAREFLPPSSAGHVLLTTRAEVTTPLARRIAIEVLPRNVGAHFLLQRAGLLAPELPLEQASAADQALAGQLCDKMGGLPLALDQAAAYIQENACRLSDYLEWYRERQTVLLGERGGLGDEHPEPVATTWSLSFEQVEHKSTAAADLLRLCAFLHPDAIPQELITQGTADLGPPLEPLGTDPLALNAALKELRAYSLLRRDPGTQTFSLHRLTQVVLKESMHEQAQREWAERIVRIVNSVFPATSADTWSQCERYLSHALACADLISQHTLASPQAAELLNQTASYLQDRGLYAQAEPLYQRALVIREQVLGPEHPDTLVTRHNLALLYRQWGQYEQAETLFQQVLASQEKVLGLEHCGTLNTRHNLAALYRQQAQYERAETLFQQVLTSREKLLGQEHCDTLNTRHNLALLYRQRGQYKQAETLYQQVLISQEKLLGPEHPDTLVTRHNLALLYQMQGQHERAEALYQQVLNSRKKVLGSEHPKTLLTHHNLALLYRQRGQYEQAETLFQQVFASQEKLLGQEHPDTLNTRHNLSILYKEQRKYGQAEALCQQVLSSQEKVLGPEHPDTARSLNNLANLYESLGQYAKALPLYQRALAVCEQQLGPEHPDTVIVRENCNALVKDMKRKRKGQH